MLISQNKYIIIILPISMSLSDFDQNFLNTFDTFGKEVLEKLEKTVQNYERYIIPFEMKRMKQNQALSFKNTSLQRQKLDLLKKAEQMSAQGQRNQYILQKQSERIIDLQRTIINMEDANNQNINLIEALKFNLAELEASGNQKLQIIRQVEGDKNQVLKNLSERNKDFDALAQNYMRDKNAIAQKMNYINQLQQNLMEKQRQIQQKQFYLKKQWQKLQQAKKQQQNQKPPQIPQVPRYVRRVSSKTESNYQQQPEPTNQKAKYQRIQILRNPVKKIIKHHNNQIYDIAFNYNGNTIATCGGDRMIKIYDVLSFRSGATIQSHSVDNIYLCLGLDYSGERLLAGSTDRSVQVFSTNTGKQLHSFVGHGYKVNSVSWTSSKQKCVSGSQDKQLKIWQVQKASNILSISCGKPIKCLTCNTIQPVIYSGHSDGSIRLYSLTQSSSPIAQVKGIIDYPINSIVVLSNRSEVLVSSQQGSPIYLIDLKMNKVVKKYETKEFFNSSVRAQLSPTEKYVVAGNCDGFIYYWNKDKQTMQKRVSGHQSSITTLKYHFLSNVLASCDKQGNVIIWQ